MKPMDVWSRVVKMSKANDKLRLTFDKPYLEQLLGQKLTEKQLKEIITHAYVYSQMYMEHIDELLVDAGRIHNINKKEK
jgi:phenylacetate-coenzyme A ligase PaaK-like adenylate-forming protein|tara:strand:- start:5758 stop:5994 length:237 start_codon:yes stop_codon:yes gene_type:complete